MKPRTPSDAAGPAGCDAVAEYPRPWTLKDGILARAGRVDPSIPGY